MDERTTRHAGYEVSQRKRKRVEQPFGWMKMIGMLKKVKLRGIDKVGWLFIFTGAAYNLCRPKELLHNTVITQDSEPKTRKTGFFNKLLIREEHHAPQCRTHFQPSWNLVFAWRHFNNLCRRRCSIPN